MTLVASDDQIETDRLLLRRLMEADLSFYARIHADPEVARYIGLGRPRSVDETRQWFDHTLETYSLFGLGQLAVVRKSDGELIGRCGACFLEIDPAPEDDGDPLGYFVRGEAPAGVTTILERELGYTFDRAAWGHGFAREAAARVHRYLSETKPHGGRVVSLIHPANVRSAFVAQACGAIPVDRVRAFGQALDRYVWPSPGGPPGLREHSTGGFL